MSTKRKRAITLAAASAAAAIILAGAGYAAASTAAVIPPGTLHGCVTGTSRTLEHVYGSNTSGTTCPKGSFQVVWPKGADNDPAPVAVPSLSHHVLGNTPETVATGGSFTAGKTLVDTVTLPAAGAYQVSVNFKAVALSGTGVAPQMFIYNGAALADFSNDLVNVGSGDLQAAGTNHDGYFSGSGVITVPAGGETLDIYAFGYGEDQGSGSYTLENATVDAVLYPAS